MRHCCSLQTQAMRQLQLTLRLTGVMLWGQAVREMSANEVILTFGWSATVFMFLREAAKKHDFQARHSVFHAPCPPLHAAARRTVQNE